MNGDDLPLFAWAGPITAARTRYAAAKRAWDLRHHAPRWAALRRATADLMKLEMEKGS